MESAVVLPVPLGEGAHVALLGPFVTDPDVGVEEELRFFFSHIDALDLELSREAGRLVVVGSPVQELRKALALRWPGTHAPDEVTVDGAPGHQLAGRVHVDTAVLWVEGVPRAVFPLADPE